MSTKKTQSKLKNWQPDPNITPAQLDTMRKEVYDRIVVARIGLLLRHPFFGNMATRLRIQAADEWLMTAAVDGRNLFFNTQFFNAMNNKEVEFVIAHEILHMVYDHLGRRDDRDPMLYNIAADYIVNNLLVRDRIGTKPKVVDCYQDFKYDKWTSEEVYDELFKQAKKNGEEFVKQLGEMLDEHLDLEGDGTEDGEGNGRPRYSKAELDQIKDEIKEAMLQAASAAGAGNVPAGVARIIKELINPRMNWREILNQQIQSVMKSNYTFMRPSRKAWHTGAVLPGMDFDQTIDIAIALDMSGSIGETQARDFLSEVKGICDQYDDYKIKIWCFDTEVYNEQDYSADSSESIEEYELQGGGGTDFDANWKYMKDNDIQPKKFIVFTDGYSYNWGDENYCDTVWVIHSDTTIEAPHGITTYYDEKVAS